MKGKGNIARAVELKDACDEFEEHSFEEHISEELIITLIEDKDVLQHTV